MLFPIKDINPASRVPVITWSLITLNALGFLYQALYGLEESILTWGLIPARLLGTGEPSIISGGRFGQVAVQNDPLSTLLTSMFMHGGLLHLGGNMLYLWIFGNNVEDRLGHFRFLAFYLVGGIAAALAHASIVLLMPGGDPYVPMVGASGAVAAVLGAYFRLFPRARVQCIIFPFFFLIFSLPAFILLGWWIFIQVFNGMVGFGIGSGGVAWFAHIGGFLMGMLMLTLMGIRPRRPLRFWS